MFTALLSLLVALAAIGVAIASWLRPLPTAAPPAEPEYTEQQVADAKTEVCEAYRLTKDEVSMNTHRPDMEGDEAGSLAVAAMKRLALYAAGDYLLDRLAAEPATPADLADSIRSLAHLYEEFGMRALNNEPDSVLDSFRRTGDTDISTIDRLCA